MKRAEVKSLNSDKTMNQEIDSISPLIKEKWSDFISVNNKAEFKNMSFQTKFFDLISKGEKVSIIEDFLKQDPRRNLRANDDPFHSINLKFGG